MFIKITAIDNTVFLLRADKINSCIIIDNKELLIETEKKTLNIQVTPEEITKFVELFN
jgi:hypothetical protein